MQRQKGSTARNDNADNSESGYVNDAHHAHGKPSCKRPATESVPYAVDGVKVAW